MEIIRQNFLIAIADDDSAILESISIMLQIEGYRVVSYLNGKGILNSTPTPDLYIIDIWMSGTDGRDLSRAIKDNPYTKNIPVILASASHELKHSLEQSKADDFLSKPFEIDNLLKIVDELISNKLVQSKKKASVN